jgi:hypothetical protein
MIPVVKARNGEMTEIFIFTVVFESAGTFDLELFVLGR